MPILGGLILAIQIAFAIHAIRSGRETYWLYIIAFLPGIGCAVYFFTQVLPEMQNSYSVRKAGNRLLKAIDPERELRRRKDELEIADTVANRVMLADECIEAGFFNEAITLLQRCQQNGHDDPDILLKLAQAQFGAKQYQQAIETLDLLIKTHPGFRSPDGHLLYARSLAETGQIPLALEEYQALSSSFPGEEARLRHAQLLQQNDQPGRARQVLEEIQLRAKRAPKYYRRKEQEWIRQAEQMLKTA
ncbi:MAG: tetratricopeptide repeat protein [Gammaproteobacteria bacterium]|nr:tetratricopeptide repeat protein [Gammaproteobacteria bacterium]MBU1722503.1 tetratricopeptide repeat protein [Gammaproteobacteria bacterium]MBU2007024.1 tetratricopeptide repeat protein [Gammaproteobacteria bacterium]